MIPRRSFLSSTIGAGALAALGDLGFLGRLPRVSAADTALDARTVQLRPEIEPIVRLLEDTPRERVLEEVAARIHAGLNYREVLAALLLAGVRNIQPRPVGFKFHAVLVVNSAHLASLASPESDRWLPIFWAIDQFKSAQAEDAKESDWTMGPVNESVVPSSEKARAAFIEAMDHWDEGAADAAAAGLARTAGANEIFELFARYGARDFRDIGHKCIYVANSFRCLETIGWQHAEPVLRSLAYALLARDGDAGNPAQSDFSADRPFRRNLEALETIRSGWRDGKISAEATADLLSAFRTASSADTGALATKMLNDGIAPQSLFDSYYNGAGELLMRAPGILAVHAVTFTNAANYTFRRVADDKTRRLLLLQNAAFLPLYRGDRPDAGVKIDTLEPLAPDAQGEAAVAEIFADISKDKLTAARKTLAYAREIHSPEAFAVAARRHIFLKGTNAHDYKFSSAVLEDYERLSPPWRDRLLAASVFYLRGSGAADNRLVQRTRAALG